MSNGFVRVSPEVKMMYLARTPSAASVAATFNFAMSGQGSPGQAADAITVEHVGLHLSGDPTPLRELRGRVRAALAISADGEGFLAPQPGVWETVAGLISAAATGPAKCLRKGCGCRWC